jgi:hypothetical protein
MTGKPRATGADAVLLLAQEASYAVAPDGSGGGVYSRLYMKSSDVSGSQTLEADDLWNTPTPDDTDPSLGAFDVSGNLVVPLDARGAGFWLTMALGAEEEPADNAGVYTHTWKSGGDIPSYTIQRGYPKLATPKWRTVLGAKAGGLSFTMARNGRATMTLPVIGQSETKDVTGARDADPATVVYLPFDNATGEVKIAGAQLANLTGATITYSSTPEAIATIRSDMEIDGVDEGKRTLTGSLNLRLGTDHTIDDLIDAGSSAALAISFALVSQPTWKLSFLLPRVRFEKPKESISGPAGIQLTTNFRAAYDSVSGYMLEATLVNDVASY